MSVGGIKGPPGGIVPPPVTTEPVARVQQPQPAAPADAMDGSAPRSLAPAIEPIVVPPASAKELEEHLAEFSALSALVGPKPKDVETAPFLALSLPVLERPPGGLGALPPDLTDEQWHLAASVASQLPSALPAEARTAAASVREDVAAALRGEREIGDLPALRAQLDKGADGKALVEAAMLEGSRGAPASRERFTHVYRALARALGVPS